MPLGVPQLQEGLNDVQSLVFGRVELKESLHLKKLLIGKAVTPKEYPLLWLRLDRLLIHAHLLQEVHNSILQLTRVRLVFVRRAQRIEFCLPFLGWGDLCRIMFVARHDFFRGLSRGT